MWRSDKSMKEGKFNIQHFTQPDDCNKGEMVTEEGRAARDRLNKLIERRRREREQQEKENK